MFSIRSNVLGIATTLRAGRCWDLVPVWARDSFFSNTHNMTACGAQTVYCTRGTVVPSWYKAGWGLNLTSHFHLVARQKWVELHLFLPNPQYTIWPIVTEVLHSVITMLEVKILLTTCRNMWHWCSRYGWYVTCSRRSFSEGTGMSCVHGVHGATHKAVYKRPQHLQQVQRKSPAFSYLHSRVFRD